MSNYNGSSIYQNFKIIDERAMLVKLVLLLAFFLRKRFVTSISHLFLSYLLSYQSYKKMLLSSIKWLF